MIMVAELLLVENAGQFDILVILLRCALSRLAMLPGANLSGHCHPTIRRSDHGDFNCGVWLRSFFEAAKPCRGTASCRQQPFV
jgi:hypothetical protein